MIFPQFDTDWLVAINGWHTDVLDVWMWNISQTLTWLPLFITLLICLIRRFGTRSILYIVSIAVCVGLADFISSGIIKELVMRPRPSREPALEGILHLVNDYKGGRYGFVSSHAANTMSICIFFSLIWRDWRVVTALSVFALLNCYSRMYLGVHYPLDILGGLIVGSSVALIVYAITKEINHLLDKRALKKAETSPYNISANFTPHIAREFPIFYSYAILGVTLLQLIVFFFLPI